MKKIASFALIAILAASMGTVAFAEEVDRKPGLADLELTDGGLKIIDIDNDDVPEGFEEIESLSVDFGPHRITGLAEDITTETPVGIIVQDARGLGEDSQWEVIVKLDTFHLVVNQSPTEQVTLAGSQLTFKTSGDIVTSVETGGAAQPTPITVELAPGAASGKKIFTSNEDGSAGTWGANWAPILNVPSTAEVGVHQAKLTWSLQTGV